ncbi:short-chain dehydrogenase [Jannaschia pagri]|uniref:Short-chain dehydrogenase n=1 Tax=Jannaschia pagri TaxID=2829797 RepID=A0ABQ4NIC1_9RHOB|nr:MULTISPECIES: SDR family oxidoreductase [unclassified Jannaschia]GIT89724.1 short-chain dehydrogenase [Jannaschia sp. AI_61]GIT94168.1 short-chain dehydrogenase [Jannaschia sp. AI_62]
MSRLAVVTGASGGIGRALARHHARKGGDLIVAARRLEALQSVKAELEGEFGVSVTPVACDLGTAEGVETLLEAARDAPVEMLINNAGFGGSGAFLDRALADDFAMLDVNVRALMALCHGIAPGMVARGKGRILNVGSTAGMMPGPLQATYFASKAYVNSFSQALDEELRPQGVTVTVLAPGYVETDFAARADLEGTLLTRRGQSAASAARVGYDAMMTGQLVAVNEPMLSVLVDWIIPLLPRRVVLKMVRRMQEKG